MLLYSNMKFCMVLDNGLPSPCATFGAFDSLTCIQVLLFVVAKVYFLGKVLVDLSTFNIIGANWLVPVKFRILYRWEA